MWFQIPVIANGMVAETRCLCLGDQRESGSRERTENSDGLRYFILVQISVYIFFYKFIIFFSKGSGRKFPRGAIGILARI
ncbi:hypothetical protein HanXRQr2_Chr14g0625731 [Helianthus annuus]|uniref:Uncharacterized protein n=1 Tax=Helianthus annuus TaxID=4232 RepID=A0A9K3H514_HELAN|nr:hypothetical protein HanXRQr2_Chr14g0625731 [Helianthus annuus]KAJ0838922.1 hypothetical protein HanPSC8_Chr14g0600511 [Helianthus annuus]